MNTTHPVETHDHTRQVSTPPVTTTTNGRTYPALEAFGSIHDTLAGAAIRLAVLVVEDRLNGPSDERETERITLVEHLLAFANTHGSTRPAAALRQALATIQYVNGQPGTPVLSVLEEIEMAIGHTN
jgi:hypothetical protein